jgi:hypothetical protein
MSSERSAQDSNVSDDADLASSIVPHPDDPIPWRKRDSCVWGVVGALHVVGLLMPVRLPGWTGAFFADGQGTQWLWHLMFAIHIRLPIDFLRAAKDIANGAVPTTTDLFQLLNMTVLLTADYVLLGAFLSFLLEAWHRFTATTSWLLVAAGLGIPVYVCILIPVLGIPGIAGNPALKEPLQNAGLWVWMLSLAAAGIGSLLLDHYRRRERDARFSTPRT